MEPSAGGMFDPAAKVSLLERNIAMIRKLSSGKYRLYSRKKNPRTGRRRNLGTFASRTDAGAPRARGAVFQAALRAAAGLTNPAAIRSPFRRLGAHDLLN